MPEHRNDQGAEGPMEDTWTVFNEIIQQDLDSRLRWERRRAKPKNQDPDVFNTSGKDSEHRQE